MNIKALITTLILGSSSAAMAKPVTFSAGASMSLGYDTQPAVRDHRAPVAHDHANCDTTPAPVYSRPEPVYTRPVRPVWQEPFFSPTNTQVAARSSTYIGSIGRAPANRFGRHTSYYSAPVRAWFNLTEATRIDSGREFFNILGKSGQLSQIRLQNLGGRSEIKQVAIEFDNGDRNQRTQVVRFDTMLDRNNPTLTIDLDGGYRTVKRIIVYGSTGRGAAYQIQAM